MIDFGKAEISYNEQLDYMSNAYKQNWNSDVQARIDQDIERHRKTNFSIQTEIPVGVNIHVEQLSHDYIFGAHIFNFNQLGSEERNHRYKAIYGSLFNSATVPFYWKTLEPEEGRPRFKEEYHDTEEFWNNCTNPKDQAHWRRPATDPIIDFCETKGIRVHGHSIAWNSTPYHTPEYINNRIPEKFLQGKDVKECFAANSTHFKQFSDEELNQGLREWCEMYSQAIANRIRKLATYYKGRVHSWDVCNESALDYLYGYINSNNFFNHARYGVMPADFTYHSFKLAEKYMPDALLNINDFIARKSYIEQTKSLIDRGCKIDIIGMQNHLWGDATCEVAEGTNEEYGTPAALKDRLKMLDETKLPIHISEITLLSPEDGLKGEAIQAVVARNFYRLWFSHKTTMGITWWNVVDDCGAAGEPCVSGLFRRDMTPKLAFHALNELINEEWKTRLETIVDKDGWIKFRGFKGNYRLTWEQDGNVKHMDVKLK